MKLGGSVIGSWTNVKEWQALLKASRFAAITSPVDCNTDKALARDILTATRDVGVEVAETGVWKNVLSPNPREREEALAYARGQLAFAEEHRIRCCVNIAGAPGPRWDGAYRENYSQQTYEAIIRTTQAIIDSVQPGYACYSLEPMPWMLPDGPDEYLQLMQDIDREQFKVHLDVVNMINSPRRSLFAHEFIEECCEKLGRYTVSCHLKDSLMEEPFTCLIRETAPGLGGLDYRMVLASLNRHLAPDTPVLTEHMASFADYAAAYDQVAKAAAEIGIAIR